MSTTISEDHFGIVASRIGFVKAEGVTYPLTSGKDVIDVQISDFPSDLTIREV